MSKNRTKNKKFKKHIVRFTEYMISGGAWFWSGYAAFAVMDKILGVPFWPTKITSYIFGASINFLLQRYWVFRVKNVSNQQVQQSAGRYYSLMFVNFVLDQAIVGGLRAIGITPYIGQFISSGFFTIWNYAWYSLWVFRRGGQPGHRRQTAPFLNRHKKARHQI